MASSGWLPRCCELLQVLMLYVGLAASIGIFSIVLIFVVVSFLEDLLSNTGIFLWVICVLTLLTSGCKAFAAGTQERQWPDRSGTNSEASLSSSLVAASCFAQSVAGLYAIASFFCRRPLLRKGLNVLAFVALIFGYTLLDRYGPSPFRQALRHAMPITIQLINID